MNKKKAIPIIAAIVVLLAIQFIHPIFKGDVLLNIPDRIRTTFEQLFDRFTDHEEDEGMGGLRDELDPDKTYELEQGNDTDMTIFGEADMVDLPDEDNNQTSGNSSTGNITTEENELPIDNFGGQ